MHDQIYRELFEVVDPRIGPPDRPRSWIDSHIIPDIKNRGYSGPVMDAGCSTGYLTNMLSEDFGTVYGVDNNEQQLIVAHRYSHARNIQYVAADFRDKLPDHIRVKTAIALSLISSIHPVDRIGVIYHIIRNISIGGTLAIYDRLCTGNGNGWDGYSSPINENEVFGTMLSVGIPYAKAIIGHSAVGHLFHLIEIRVLADTASKFMAIPERQRQFTA